MKRRNLVIALVVLLAALVALVSWILLAGKAGPFRLGGARLATGTSPALDIRFSYNPQVLELAPADNRAEYPLQLMGQGWNLVGKRLGGFGRYLQDAPAPMIYDFVVSQHSAMYEDLYKLEREIEEYEDATIQGRLAVHCRWRYKRTADTLELPYYMPEAVRTSGDLESEGWALFTKEDLFYFYTFSAEPLTDKERDAVLQVLNSIQFRALGTDNTRGGRRDEAPVEEPGPEAQQAPDTSQPPSDSTEPPAGD